ncbi:MAG: LapA family protein [Nitrospirota bacterium]
MNDAYPALFLGIWAELLTLRKEFLMPLFLIVALVMAVLVVIFALQNAIPITVTLFVWKFEGSLALVLLLSLALGVIMGLLVSMPAIIKKSWKISNQNKKIEELERSLQRKIETSSSKQSE